MAEQYTLIFRQTMPYVSWTTSNIGVNNVNDNNNDNYSIMNILNGFNTTAASPYIFKYVAYTTVTGDVYGGKIELVFSQSSNPLTTTNSVTDSNYISGVGWGVGNFNGLSLSSLNNTIIDGTSGDNNWWGAIGSTVSDWNGGRIPSINGQAAYRVELYVETTNIPLFITSDGSLLSSVFQPVETSTTGDNLRPTDQYDNGFNKVMTYQQVSTLNPEKTFTGIGFCSQRTGSKGYKDSYYINSLAYLSESEAGTWNFAMKTSDDIFCSLFVLEGNYAWDKNLGYNTDSIVFGIYSSPWTGNAVKDGVSTFTMPNFISWVNTNHPSANITKVLDVTQATTSQVNGSYTFEANKQYSILIYWRHHNSQTGLSNTLWRFGYWKQGDATPTLPSTTVNIFEAGRSVGNQQNDELLLGRGAVVYPDYTMLGLGGDLVPPWWYRRIPESSGLFYGSTPTNLIGDYILHDGSNPTPSSNTGFVAKQPFTDGETTTDLKNIFTVNEG
jgi:hypothetical protein